MSRWDLRGVLQDVVDRDQLGAGALQVCRRSWGYSWGLASICYLEAAVYEHLYVPVEVV